MAPKHQVISDFSTVVKGGPYVLQNLETMAVRNYSIVVNTQELNLLFHQLTDLLNYEGIENDHTKSLNLRDRQGKQGFVFEPSTSNYTDINSRTNPAKMHIMASSKSPSYNKVVITGGYQNEF
jgi:hypothetical protein